jgi:hypothetical protein
MTSQEVIMKKKNGLAARPKETETETETESGTESLDAGDAGCQRPAQCIFCHGTRVWWNGRHERTASVLEGDDVVHITGIVQRRARCANCRDSWIVRLLNLFPGRHFQLEVVAEALAQYLFNAETTQRRVAAWATCAVRTLRRWIEWVGQVSTPRELVARMTELTGQPVLLNNPMGETAQKGGSDTRRQLARMAAWNLVLLEAIGAALGLEPPGLRAVLLRVVGDRAGATTYARPALPELARSLN